MFELEFDLSSVRKGKKVHSQKEGEQLGLSLDFSTIRKDPPSQTNAGDHHPPGI